MIDYKPIESANLPQNNVKHVVVSPKYRFVSEALENLGVHSLMVSECHDLIPALSLHADMLVHHLGGRKVIVEKSQLDLQLQLIGLGFEILQPTVQLGCEYPDDISLNCCVVGEKVIVGRKNSFYPKVTDKSVIRTAQGYAKCSTVVVDENSIITDDESVAEQAKKSDLDVLLVRKGDITLDGMDYGFIGGCCGKISKDTLAFCGDISTHRDAVQIRAFLHERGVHAHSLSGGKLVDIGSIIPITEVIMKRQRT